MQQNTKVENQSLSGKVELSMESTFFLVAITLRCCIGIKLCDKHAYHYFQVLMCISTNFILYHEPISMHLILVDHDFIYYQNFLM
jgi:hypothetical protein